MGKDQEANYAPFQNLAEFDAAKKLLEKKIGAEVVSALNNSNLHTAFSNLKADMDFNTPDARTARMAETTTKMESLAKTFLLSFTGQDLLDWGADFLTGSSGGTRSKGLKKRVVGGLTFSVVVSARKKVDADNATDVNEKTVDVNGDEAKIS